MGDMSSSMFWKIFSYYLPIFYSDIFQLSLGQTATLMFVTRFWDTVSDPMMGIIADRTQTRWGKYRPWVLWTAVPFCVFYVLAFWNPGIEDKGLVALYATVSYVLLMSMYSMNNTPYSALGGVMTGDIRERTSITSVRFVGSTVAQFVVQGLTLPLVSKFGGDDAAHGWFCTVSLYAGVCLLCFIITFISARERITPPPGQETNIREDIKELLANVPWRAMFVLTLFVFITLAMWGSAMSFYFQNFVDQQALFAFLDSLGLVRPEGEGAALLTTFNLIAHSEADAYAIGFSLFNMTGALVQFIGVVLLSNYLANRFGKKSTFVVCLALTALFTAMFWVPAPTDVGLMFALCVAKSLAYAPTVPLLWAMMGDVADHIEYVNHRRATGTCFSGVVFALKAGLGLGGAFAGLLLSVFGYVSASTAVQSASAVTGIRLAASIVPAALFGVGVIALIFYPISKRYNEKMQAELAARRSGANS